MGIEQTTGEQDLRLTPTAKAVLLLFRLISDSKAKQILLDYLNASWTNHQIFFKTGVYDKNKFDKAQHLREELKKLPIPEWQKRLMMRCLNTIEFRAAINSSYCNTPPTFGMHTQIEA